MWNLNLRWDISPQQLSNYYLLQLHLNSRNRYK